MKLVAIFLLIFCSFCVLRGVQEVSHNVCKSKLIEIGVDRLLLRKLLAVFDKGYNPYPFPCLIPGKLEMPVEIIWRTEIVYMVSTLAAYAIVFLRYPFFQSSTSQLANVLRINEASTKEVQTAFCSYLHPAFVLLLECSKMWNGSMLLFAINPRRKKCHAMIMSCRDYSAFQTTKVFRNALSGSFS